MAKLDLVVVVVVVAAVALQFQPIHAQQEYNEVTGYVCSGVQQNCTAYAFYRTQGTNSTLNSTAALFSTTAAAVTSASNTTANANALLPDMTELTIPLECGCENRTYRAPTTYTVQPNDTMFDIANRTFEGLVTFQAIVAANPSIEPTRMLPSTRLVIPVRCACPTRPQMDDGTASLLTYAVFPGEDLQSIGDKYDVSLDKMLVTNMLRNSSIQAFSTVLVPLKSSSNTSSPIPPGDASPNAASAGSRAHGLLVVAVAAAAMLALLS